MRWLRTKWIVAVAILMGLMITPIVSSYSVSPGKWEVYMYEDYEITPQTKLSIIIDNTHNASISIRLSVYTNPATTKQGYEPLPDEDFHWIQFKETDVTIPPHTKYNIPLIIDVANDTENYNKSWQFYIKCDQYAGGDSNGTATFQYDYNLIWTIKTPPSYVPLSERGDKSNPVEKTMPLFFVTLIIILGAFLWYRHSKKKDKNEKSTSSKNRNGNSDFSKR